MAILVVCDVCQSEFNLKDEFGGKKVRCKQCQNVMRVPEADLELTAAESHWVDRGYHPAFDRDRFFVNQKRISINEKYFVFDEDKNPILFIERKAHLLRQLLMIFAGIAVMLLGIFLTIAAGTALRGDGGDGTLGGVVVIVGMILSFAAMIAVIIALAPKRHVEIYSDKERSELLLKILQDQKFALLTATYTVQTPEGEPLGSFRKNYLHDFLRKRWEIRDPAGAKYLLAKEDSVILALLRRFLGPFFGVLRTNFIVVPPDSETVLGEFNRKFTLFDRYVLDMTNDVDHRLDRRMAVAMAVLLDTGERR